MAQLISMRARPAAVRFIALLALIAVGVTAVSAHHTVTGGRCAPADSAESVIGPCVTGSVLTLRGSGFTDSGVLVAFTSPFAPGVVPSCTARFPNVTEDGTELQCVINATEVSNGLYQVSVSHADGSDTTSAGAVMIGEYLQLDVKGWTPAPSITNAMVSGYSNGQPSTGDVWRVFGVFNSSTKYQVLLHNKEAEAAKGNDGGSPRCLVTAVYVTWIECTMSVHSGVIGMWGLLVEEVPTGAYLPSPALSAIAVNPLSPVVTRATGACAGDSSRCVTGAALTLAGTGFNIRGSSFNRVTIGGSDGRITCKPTEVSATELTCTLTVPSGTPAGQYQITVDIEVCTMPMYAPAVAAGSLIIGGGSSSSGWTPLNIQDYALLAVVQRRPVAATVLAIMFGIAFFAVAVALLVIVLRCQIVPKRRAQEDAAGDEMWATGYAATQPSGGMANLETASHYGGVLPENYAARK